MTDTLLPAHSSAMMVELEKAAAVRLNSLLPFVERIGERYNNPQPDLMPYLLREAGLGIISQYVDNPYDLYEQGLAWLKLRGEQAAVYKGLGFIGYSGELDNAPSRRRYWADDQLHLSRIPDTEADLRRIDGVVKASLPARTRLFRGYHGYDARASEPSYSRLSGSMLSDLSGVRIEGSDPKWSFGESYEFDVALGQVDLDPLGIYIDPGGALSFSQINTPFSQVDVPFAALGPGLSLQIMAQALVELGCYIGFYRDDGSLIGARRPTACHSVAGGSTYFVAGSGYDPSETGGRVYVSCLTDFADGAGETVAFVGLLFGASPRLGIPVGQRWLAEADIDMPYEPISQQPLSADFTRTKRLGITYLIRFI